jgi:hypothetical protein
VLKVKVKAIALLRSRLVGPVLGVLPTFLSAIAFASQQGSISQTPHLSSAGQ